MDAEGARTTPRDTVLELAAGGGDTGFAAAAIVGERGRLISTDFSPDVVEVARPRGAELGLRNVDYRGMDVERIELDADPVDGVLCRFGYMLTADPAGALPKPDAFCVPGGRLVLSVWGAPERNPWAAIGAESSSSVATCRHRSPGPRGSSAWRTRSGRAHCSRGRPRASCNSRTLTCSSSDGHSYELLRVWNGQSHLTWEGGY